MLQTWLLLCPALLGMLLPPPDPVREAVLFDAEAGPRQKISSRRGKWAQDRQGLRLVEPPEFGEAYFLLDNPARFSDGMVRARLRIGPRSASTILLRAGVPPGHPEEVTAFGLEIDRRQVSLRLWKRGHWSDLSAEKPLPPGLVGQELEALIQLEGSRITARLFECSRGEELATLAVRDDRAREGRLGFHVHPSGRADGSLVRLSVSRGSPPGVALAAGVPVTGPKLLVSIPFAFTAQVPPGILLSPIDRRPGDSVARFLSTPSGIEALHRLDVPIREARPEFGFRFLDPPSLLERDRGLVATASGFDLGDGFHGPQQVAALLRGYAARFPDRAFLQVLGRSHQGRPILALRITAPPVRRDRPAVLLAGGHHGNEPMSTLFVLDAIQTLLEPETRAPEIDRYLQSFEIWCLPLVNPDGAHAFLEQSWEMGRKNGRDVDGDGVLSRGDGVDLNRNYPFRFGALAETGSRSWSRSIRFRGPSPGSEPETQALMALAHRQHFVAAVSYHSAANAILSPYTIPGVESPAPDEAWDLASKIARRVSTRPGSRKFRVLRRLYPVDGTDQDWLRHSFGTLAFIVESPASARASLRRRHLAVDSMRLTWETVLDQLIEGPTLALRVEDGQGRPLVARVTISGQVLRAAERWTTREWDGRMDRLLPGRGVFSVRAEREGHAPAEATFTAGQGTTFLTLVLHSTPCTVRH